MKAELIAVLVIVISWLTAVAAWLTHVIVCIKTASYVFLLAGALVFPVGVIHGIMCWFGVY